MDEETKNLTNDDTTRGRDIELKIHEEKNKTELENFWRSCSGCIIDKRSLTFFTTLCISLIIIAFCIVKLSLTTSCEETNTWLALLMFVIGIWIKNPSM